MDLQQLKLGSKVKLKLIQPSIKCSGRDDVAFQTRGKIIDLSEDYIKIEFKSKGELISVLFDKKGNCITYLYEDLNII